METPLSSALESVPLGSTGLMVSPLCVGTSGWGRLRPGEDDTARRARVGALAARALSGEPGLGYLDSSNIYGGGAAEIAIGDELEHLGGLPSGAVVQTKLDRRESDGDFSGDQMWRSLEQSLQRLHVDALQILFLHDPEHIGFGAAMAPGGPVDALMAMKEQGLTEQVGISGGPVDMLDAFVSTGRFDLVISHNRYTLIDRSAVPMFENARRRGMAVNNAAPYGGGSLSGRPGAAERYGYRSAPVEVRKSVAAMSDACLAVGVPLRAAALQFSLRSPLVDSTVVGTSSGDRLDEALADARVDIPDALWAELDRVAPNGFALDAPTA
jgi:D-threo-aldose 1-dehydrogenase